MDNYDTDSIEEEVENTEAPAGSQAAAAAGSNRNFLMALGVLGGIFLLLTIVLVAIFMSNRPDAAQVAGIQSTNAAIYIANTRTAGEATQMAIEMLTPSATLPPTFTPVPPTPTRTLVVALATATGQVQAGAAQVSTATPTATGPTSTLAAAALTGTAAVNPAAAATQLPQSGFAEDVGLPGLFGMSIGLLLVIVLVRRLRFSTGG